MAAKQQLAVLDYVMIVAMLLISMAIGWKFRPTKAKGTTTDYLMAGKNMMMFPVILSISVTWVSGFSFIITPTEVYRYDIQLIFMSCGTILGILISMYGILPIYFNCKVSTVYEYVEMRYGKVLKYIFSAFFIFNTLLTTSFILFPPVLALSSVTDLSIKWSIILCGSVCTLYCLVGGMKGVLWTDAFQFLLMVVLMIILQTVGFLDAGGISSVFQKALVRDKLNVDFSLSITKRFTFWNTITQGILFGIAAYGLSQMEVQRALSLGNMKRAKKAFFISLVPLSMFMLLSKFIGLILFAIYFNCDPVFNQAETGIYKYEQIVLYYLVNRLAGMPGMTGLCIAGIFSGSLSTTSSIINSFATVAVNDIIKPLVHHPGLNDKRLLIVAKIISLLYGTLCIALTFLLINVKSLLQLILAFFGILTGPSNAVLILGMLSSKVSEKCAIAGFFLGLILNSFFSYGSLFDKYTEPPRNLGTNCSSIIQMDNLTAQYANATLGESTSLVPDQDVFEWRKISFMWIKQIGFVNTIVIIFIFVLLTGGWRKDFVPADSPCLSPFVRAKSTKDVKTPPVIDIAHKTSK